MVWDKGKLPLPTKGRIVAVPRSTQRADHQQRDKMNRRQKTKMFRSGGDIETALTSTPSSQKDYHPVELGYLWMWFYNCRD